MKVTWRDRLWARWYLRWHRIPWSIRRPFDLAWAFVRHGARPVLQGPTSGEFIAEGVEIGFSGMCPVQGDGTVDGHEVYYRSRGAGWSLSIAATPGPSGDAMGDDAWEYFEDRYFWPAGGYVDASVSRECIRRAVAKWRGRKT